MRLLAAIIALTSVASGAQPPGERSRIIALRARADAEASVVELEGDRPLSFTTLRLDAPPRVVLDFADARFDGVPEELPLEDCTVRRAAAAEAPEAPAPPPADRPPPPPENPQLPTVALVGRTRPPPVAAPPRARTGRRLAAATPAPPPPAKKAAARRPQRSAIHGIGFRPSSGGVVIVRTDRPVEDTVA